MKEKIIALYQAKREFTILQSVFLIFTLFSLIVAGLLALINQPVGVSALIVPTISAVVLIANIVVWALTKMVIDSIISRDTEAKKAAAKETKKK